MSDHPPSAVVRSRIDRKRRLSLIWAIPVVTLFIGAWLAWETISERGPLITITFETAEGLQATQSHVRHKEVDMGVVQKIALTPDLKRVQVTVRMNKEAEPLLTDQAQFWVVRPRFFAGSITGLSTLVSGSYIDLLPSGQGGPAKRDFVGLENPPVLQSDVPGRTFLLQANSIGSLNLGSPITYRDLEVGEILGWDVGEMARDITVHAFVRAPFDKYVRDNSRFWNASGASVHLGANGLQLQVQ
jgi:paraquat-inducible protein B